MLVPLIVMNIYILTCTLISVILIKLLQQKFNTVTIRKFAIFSYNIFLNVLWPCRNNCLMIYYSSNNGCY